MEFPTEAPEWLAELRAEPGPPSVPTAPAFEGIAPSPPAEPEIGMTEMEGLARAAIPDWLEALRPHPEAPAAAAEAEPVEIEGLLKGVRGALAPITTFQVPAIRESTGPSEISKVSLARAQLLQSLLARPAEALQPQARKRTRSDGRGVSMGERVQRWLVAAVLLIAVGGILIAPLIPFNIPALTQPTTSPGVSRLHNAIQGLSAGDTVLVAFEYGPAEADELDLVAEPILRHVLAQGARISVVSTRPERLAVAEGLLSTIEAPEEQYTQRYRPGDATGVSQLLAEVDNQPTLLLVLTAQPGPLRWWVEQAHALYGDTIPVAAGVSAALEPAASPYLDVSARQMEGAIIGLRGAAAYETPGESPERGTLRLNALAVGHLAIVGLMILGASLYALDGLRGRGE
jgi:IS5 family transposase